MHLVPNILSLCIASNWENSDAFHFSQSIWFFNLSLVLLPVSVNPGDITKCSIACDIFQGWVQNV